MLETNYYVVVVVLFQAVNGFLHVRFQRDALDAVTLILIGL